MQILKLAWKNIWNKPLNVALSLALFALSAGLISFLLLLNHQVEQKFEKNLASIDMVIGAKGSPLQLILCNMYHIDNPTGNIDLKEASPFLNPKHPLIEKAIPLSLGDSYSRYRIVGTIPDMLNVYQVAISEGRQWQTDMEVTIGATVAQQTGLKIGDTFNSSHGMDDGDGLEHDHHHPFKVVGILAPSNTVLDQLILTNTASLWMVHDHEEESHNHALGSETNTVEGLRQFEDKQITSVLVLFKNNNFRTLNMPRAINEHTKMQAASPAYEINKMYAMMGNTQEIFTFLILLIVLVTAASLFILLYHSLSERKYEMALLRVMGGKPHQLFSLLIIEALFIALLGVLFGLFLSHIGIWFATQLLEDQFKYRFDAFQFLADEGWIIAGAVLIGLVAAFVPALLAARTNIAQILGNK